MNIVYKYCSERGLEAIENMELKITPPNQFNDPFEFTPHMIWSDPIAKATEVLKNGVWRRALYDLEHSRGNFPGSYSEFEDYVSRHLPDMASALAQAFPHGVAEAQRDLLDTISKEYGVLCLSERRDSILMWGHYSKSHIGLVVGFDGSSSVFKTQEPLAPVTYVRTRVIYDATRLVLDPKITAFHNEIVFSKNADWSYEREVRQLYLLADLKQRPLKDGTVGYFLPLPAETLVSVTLGARAALTL
jgi:hypothetical protein